MRDRSRSSNALQCVLLFTTLTVLCSSLSVAAVEKRRFDIAAGEAARTLNEFSRQAELQIYFDVDAVRTFTTRAVTGEFEAADALARMLGGTGLVFEFVNNRTIAVMPSVRGVRAIRMSSAEGRKLRSSAYADDADRSGSRSTSPAATSSGQTDAVTRDDEASARYIEQVVVTGTRIRGLKPESSPLTVYDREDIERMGVANVSELVRKIPQNFALIDSNTAIGVDNNLQALQNGNLGTSINLRGLGSTLVLLNGNRLAPAGFYGSLTDVSMIPLSAVQRVEILTDGASGVYGADAVAGVVNFVLLDAFDGAETTVRYGDTTGGGASERTISQLFGGSWNAGSALLAYEYNKQEELDAVDRSFVPTQNGRLMILPSQQRHSAFVNVRHGFASGSKVFARGLIGTRDFVQDYDAFSLARHTFGTTRQYATTLGVEQRVSDKWYADLVANYSKMNEERTAEIPALAFSLPGKTHQAILSADASVDGSLFSMAGGDARLLVGGGIRREEYDDFGTVSGVPTAETDLTRDVTSVYAEVFLPVVSSGNAVPAVSRLELTLSGRYDDYEGLGSSADPRFGALWSPLPGINLRGTYGTSYRVPPLAQLSEIGLAIQTRAIANPASPRGVTDTLIVSLPGNASLKPEEATSYTIGFDVTPAALRGMSFSATYFKIDFTDRIARPPLVGSVISLYSQTAALAPFIDFAPTPSAVQRLFSEADFINDRLRRGPVGVEAIFDNRLHNIAAVAASGFEILAEYALDTRNGDFRFFINGDRLSSLDYRSASTTPEVNLAGKTFNPTDLRARAGVSWTLGGFGSSLSANYSDSYENNLVTPVGEIGSWTTFDLRVSYSSRDDAESSPLGTFILALNAQNLTDRDPPAVVTLSPSDVNYGFDATNASPRGRFLEMQITKRW